MLIGELGLLAILALRFEQVWQEPGANFCVAVVRVRFGFELGSGWVRVRVRRARVRVRQGEG